MQDAAANGPYDTDLVGCRYLVKGAPGMRTEIEVTGLRHAELLLTIHTVGPCRDTTTDCAIGRLQFDALVRTGYIHQLDDESETLVRSA